MKKIITILAFAALPALLIGCREEKVANPNESQQKDVVYEYAYPYGSEENHYIVLTEKNGKTVGLYYGNSDDFDEAREGYDPGFFVVPMNELKIGKDTIRFVLDVKDSNMLDKPINLQIKSTQEALNAGYKNWYNSMRYTAPLEYIGSISADRKTIFFKEQNYMTLDRQFVKKDL